MTATAAVLCRILLDENKPLSISQLAERSHDSARAVGEIVLQMRDSGVLKLLDEGWMVEDQSRARKLVKGRPLDADGLRISSLCTGCGAPYSFMVTWRREQ